MCGKITITVALIVLVAMLSEFGNANPIIGEKEKVNKRFEIIILIRFQTHWEGLIILEYAFGIVLNARKCMEHISKDKCALNPVLSTEERSFQVRIH